MDLSTATTAGQPVTDVQIERRGHALSIMLDRPKALNALSYPMCLAIDPALKAAIADPLIRHIVIHAAGDRAFCAGGDVRAVATALRDPDSTLPTAFFQAEYRMNRRISRCPKPYVSLVNGICMGGGVGLSVHGRFRVVTETLVFAMPETGIGLFPDVGASWFLPRCPGAVGRFLGLTGARLGAADALAIGYATHFVPAAVIGQLRDALFADDADDVEATISRFARPAGDSALAVHRAAIDRCFGQPSVEAILAALAAEKTDWAQGWLDQLATKSPTSLKVTLAALDYGATVDIEAALKMEFRLTQHFMAGGEFAEGIRALLIDKDNRPQWRPADLAAVTPAIVAGFMTMPPVGDLEFND